MNLQHRTTFYEASKLTGYQLERDCYLIEFNNPELRNAMDVEMAAQAREIKPLLKKRNPRVIVFTGKGDIFSAGGDLSYLESLTHKDAKENEKVMYQFYNSFLQLSNLPCPTIAYVNGHSVGAGFCFALSCDLIYVHENAKVGLNFVKLGISPGMGAEKWLQRLPAPIAKELIFSGEILKARELASYHLFNYCSSAQEIEDKVSQMVSLIASNSRLAIQLSLPLLRQHTMTFEEVLNHQAKSQATCFEKPQVREAINAVKNKVPYIFSD